MLQNAPLCDSRWRYPGGLLNAKLWRSRPPQVTTAAAFSPLLLGDINILSDAVDKLPLDSIQDTANGSNIEVVSTAAREGVQLAREFSGLSEGGKWKVLAGAVAGWIYLTAKPGVLQGALDAYVLAPVQAVVGKAKGRRNLSQDDFVVGQRLGEGSFGTVYTGKLLPRGMEKKKQELGRRSRRAEEYEGYESFQEVTLKKVKLGVEGAEECGDMEEWFNYRMARTAPDACAEFLGSFVANATRGQFTAGGKWLVWKFEGDSTLEDFLTTRNFPENLAEPLFGKRLNEKDPLKRKSAIIKRIMKQIITGLKKMHATGIVHRDVKPSNIVLTNKGKLKFIDFGAATDLRVGKNYVPDRGLLDPDYCPPEQLVMPEKTPRPPPAPIAALLSPFLWKLNSPDLFDMYSAGTIMLQMAAPSLRTPTSLQVLKKELASCNYDLDAWRKKTKLRPNLDVLLDVAGGQGWDLVKKLVCDRRKRLSAQAALRHPYFLLPS